MMRSLSSAVAGLRSHQTKMDVIGNNIANVNTYGFKASRTTFADVYYQNLGSGSSPNPGTSGGTNPTQIGYGSNVATIDILNTQAGASSTDRALDVYITGDGFLATKDAMGNFMYTRLGNLGFDAKGQLIDSAGNLVLGFPTKDGKPSIGADGTVQGGDLSPIQVEPDMLDKMTGISISAGGEIIGIMPGDVTVNLGSATPAWINKLQTTVKSDSNWAGDVQLSMSSLPNDMGQLKTALGLAGAATVTNIDFGTTALLNATTAPNQTTLETDALGNVTFTGWINDKGTLREIKATGQLIDGKIVLKDDKDKTVLTMTVSDKNAVLDGTVVGPTDLTMKDYYQIHTTDKGGNKVVEPEHPGEFSLTSTYPQPFTIGNITFQLNEDPFAKTGTPAIASPFNGTIGRVGPGESEKVYVGCIVLAKFPNAAGLEQAGGSKYVQTLNSGDPTFVKPGLEGTGSLKANYLEMSNVDISNEFTQMIVTQRGFQANTRIVTVSDEMLQELVNLKR